jgi:hypothetical protein
MIDFIWEKILDALNNKRWEKGDKSRDGVPSIGESERRNIKNCVVVFQKCLH